MNAVQQLLTDHLDIWTAADTAKKSGRGRSSGNAGSVYGIKKLRELILELAVRGKLVPQDANDESASELLKRIQAEKVRLIAEGRIKKDKTLAPITEDEKPFELPEGWEWVRLPDIYYSLSVSGNQLLSSEIKESGLYPVVDQGQRFIAGYTDDETLLIRLPGPVVVFGDHTTERKFIEFDFVAGADGVKILRPILQNERFFWLQLVALKLEGRGYARHFRVLNECFYAIPPLYEQAKIVAKVDELMALCDQLETRYNNAAEAHEKLVSHLLGTLTQSQSAEDFSANWQRIAAHFDTLFTTEASIAALKQTLLQLAVMGKLVSQDASDEPARELLKRIQAEKARLIAEGKIKQDKPRAAISDEEKPFELPQRWEWVRLEDLMPEFQNGASSRGDTDGESVVVLRLADIIDRCISLEDPRELLISPNMIDKYRLLMGDILIVRVNGSADLVGGFIVCEHNFDGIYCDHFIRMRVSQDILNPKFLALVGASQLVRDRIKDLFITTAGQKTVNQGHIGSLLIPLLNVGEQQRIVAKVDELMALCDQLKSRITAASQLQQKLAQVMVEQVVA